MNVFAILGSCATRDVWRVNDLPAQGLLTLSRHSLASLQTPPVLLADPPERWGSLTPGGFDERCIRTELGKTALDRLEARDPDTLLFDFVSERHDLLALGDAVVLDSVELRRSGLPALAPLREARRIRRLSTEAHALWLSGLEALRRRIAEGPLARARIILHRCSWATHWLHDGTVRPLGEARDAPPELPAGRAALAAGNILMNRCHDSFLQAFPQATVVEARPEFRVADPFHLWGPGPCHFVDDYHRDLLRSLAAAGVRLPGSEVTATPT